MLSVVVDAIKAFYGFRDALYAKNTPELMQCFRPDGRKLSELDIQQLAADLKRSAWSRIGTPPGWSRRRTLPSTWVPAAIPTAGFIPGESRVARMHAF